jgi:universal stress protein A
MPRDPGEKTEATMAEWRNICCAVDFSEPSRLAMRQAASLASHFQAELTLLHVHEPPPPSATDLLVSPPEMFEQAATQMERILIGWCKDAEEIARRPVKRVLLFGKPAAEIVRYVRENAFDLVVVSTHGRTGLRHVVLGSVAERIVRSAGRPVLVVPVPGGRTEDE